jgi:hypothetical protein
MTDAAARIAAKYGLEDVVIRVDKRGRTSYDTMALPDDCPDLTSPIADTSHYELCVAIMADGVLVKKAEASFKKYGSTLYTYILEHMMDVASSLVGLKRLTSDVRTYPGAVKRCIDAGATPSACTELILAAFTRDELSAYFVKTP